MPNFSMQNQSVCSRCSARIDTCKPCNSAKCRARRGSPQGGGSAYCGIVKNRKTSHKQSPLRNVASVNGSNAYPTPPSSQASVSDRSTPTPSPKLRPTKAVMSLANLTPYQRSHPLASLIDWTLLNTDIRPMQQYCTCMWCGASMKCTHTIGQHVGCCSPNCMWLHCNRARA